MKNKSIKSKVVTGVLLASIFMSMGSIASAQSKTPTSKNMNKICANKNNKMKKCLDIKCKADKFKDNKIKKGLNVTTIKTKLDGLVKSGTITQEQEDKITSYMTQKNEERKAEMDKVSKMTKTERKAYCEQKKSMEKPDLLKDLVAKSIISQPQADAIGKVLPNKGMRR